MSVEIKEGYRLTEAGKIPDEWMVVPFSQVTDLITCGIAATPKYVAESFGFPFLSSTNIKNGKISWRDFKYIDKDLHKLLYKNNPPVRGDILYSRVGTIGEAAVIEVDFEFSVYVSLTLIKPGRLLDSYFLMHLLSSFPYKRRAKEQVYLGGGVGNLNVDIVRKYPIVVPSITEQRAIATALSDMDALISGLDQLIAKKRDIKQATMQQLLTGQTRLPGFSGEWEVKSLGDLETEKCLKLFRGKVISKKDIEKSPGNYPIYSSSVKENGVFGYYGEFMLDEELITWSVDGGGHFFYRQKHKFSVTNVCGYLRVGSPRINCRFLAFQLQFLHSRMLFDYSSKAHPSVIRKAYEIMLPRSDEQSAIASTLSDMDSEISILEARCDKARQLKQGMMQELLTGRIRLI